MWRPAYFAEGKLRGFGARTMLDTGLIVFAGAAILALTSLLPVLAQRLRLPYSVLLASVGSALGLLVAVRSDLPEGFITDLMTALSGFHISSQALLVLFLPTLLFKSALAVDIRRMFSDVVLMLVMAIIAVIMCTVTVGITLASYT